MGEPRAELVRITGRVQGVWFRAWTVEQARRRRLIGWVRNRTDGSVEALFAGPKEKVEEMIDACRSGPHGARVDRVEREPADNRDAGESFIQRPTV